MDSKFQLEHFLRKIELDCDTLNSRLDGIFGSSEYAKMVCADLDMTVPLILLRRGFDVSINNFQKENLNIKINDRKDYDKSMAELFISICNGLYGVGYDAGAKVYPYGSSDLLVNAVMENLAYNVILYSLGAQQADDFRQKYYQRISYLLN